jgi:muconolactone delta-isomerase
MALGHSRFRTGGKAGWRWEQSSSGAGRRPGQNWRHAHPGTSQHFTGSFSPSDVGEGRAELGELPESHFMTADGEPLATHSGEGLYSTLGLSARPALDLALKNHSGEELERCSRGSDLHWLKRSRNTWRRARSTRERHWDLHL